MTGTDGGAKKTNRTQKSSRTAKSSNLAPQTKHKVLNEDAFDDDYDDMMSAEEGGKAVATIRGNT